MSHTPQGHPLFQLPLHPPYISTLLCLCPAQDIQRFILRSLGEKRQLYYATEHLGTSFKDPDSWTPEAFVPKALREKLR